MYEKSMEIKNLKEQTSQEINKYQSKIKQLEKALEDKEKQKIAKPLQPVIRLSINTSSNKNIAHDKVKQASQLPAKTPKNKENLIEKSGKDKKTG